MPIAQGVVKQTRFKRQSAKGSLAGAASAQVLRRKTSVWELQKETYDTNDEINSAQQMQSFTHGPKKVSGTIDGLLSPGTYSDMLSAILRRDFTAVTAIASASFTIATSGANYTITRAAGSYLTDGVKAGMIGRITAGAFNAANLNKNFLILSVTATIATVRVLNGLSLFAEGPIASATMSFPGKVTYAANVSHTNIYYTIEEWYSDVAQAEQNTDVQIGQAQISMPGSGNATIQLSGEGLGQTQSTSAYFTTPTAETATDVVAAANGALIVNGVAQAVVTNLSFTVNGQIAALEGVVGSNTRPDISRGKVMVSGSFTAFFEDYVIPTLFTAETEFAILQAATSAATAASDFVSFAMHRVKLASSTPDDGETGLKRTYNFTAIYNAAGGTGIQTEKTTFMVHDSAAA